MPMYFLDYPSLIQAARVHHFRMPLEGEPEAQYRALLAAHVAPVDAVESLEIQYKWWPPNEPPPQAVLEWQRNRDQPPPEMTDPEKGEH